MNPFLVKPAANGGFVVIVDEREGVDAYTNGEDLLSGLAGMLGLDIAISCGTLELAEPATFPDLQLVPMAEPGWKLDPPEAPPEPESEPAKDVAQENKRPPEPETPKAKWADRAQRPPVAEKQGASPLEKRCASLLATVNASGGNKRWVPLTYDKLQGVLNCSAPVVRSAIDACVKQGALRVHRQTRGEHVGNWFAIPASQGGIDTAWSPSDTESRAKAGDALRPSANAQEARGAGERSTGKGASPGAKSDRAERPAPAQPSPQATGVSEESELDDTHGDALMGALLGISERVKATTFEVPNARLAARSGVPERLLAGVLHALTGEGLIDFRSLPGGKSAVITIRGAQR